MFFICGLLAVGFTGGGGISARPHVTTRRGGSKSMSAHDWLASEHDRLPLLKMPVTRRPGDPDGHGLLLPGESAVLKINRAEDLAALDEADDDCVGCLFVTPQKCVLATTVLLEIREVRRRPIGAAVDVVSTGRLRIDAVDHERFYSGRGLSKVCDIPAHSVDGALSGRPREIGCSSQRHHDHAAKDGSSSRLREQLEQAFIDERVTRMRDELCVIDLDQPPASSLSRFYKLWGVDTEAAAEAQLASFAACGALNPFERSLALGLKDTSERIEHAHRCLLHQQKRAAASLALHDALATFG
jgi:hypothetical protein